MIPPSYQQSHQRAEYVYNGLLQEIKNSRTIYVGGTNAPGESEFLVSLYPHLIFVDDNKAGSQIFGRSVISTQDLARKADYRDFLINNCFTAPGFNHFSRQSDSLGIPTCSTLEAMAPHYKNGVVLNFPGLISVYGPAFHWHTFNHIEKYSSLRNRFSDKLSLRTFDNIIEYRLSGNPNLLQNIAIGYNTGTLGHDSYILNSQLFSLTRNEVFVDAGALDGAHSQFFIESVNGEFDRIVMFEPSTESIKKCRETVKRIAQKYSQKSIHSKIDIVGAGLYSHQGILSLSLSLFDQNVTANQGALPHTAHILETGLTNAFVEKGNEYQVIEVPVTTLDDYMGDSPVTFIKFEIEGSEVAALHGAINTIKKNRPKLALSIYHRPQDLELIMEFVDGLELGYKYALRAHNPYCPDAIVLYCWIPAH
jgi:FkbM family methyltransferase